MNMTIEPLTPSIGAEVLGVALASVPDDPPTAGAIGEALARHQVLVFRDQRLDREQHKAFGRVFGELHVHPSKRSAGAKGDPEIFTVKADENTTRNNGGRWHMDVSCEKIPPAGSILHLTETPGQGGDTMFANMHLAYEALSPPIRKLLNGLDARHDGLQDLRWYGYEPDPSLDYPAATHPIVVAHPVTGRPTLNVNEAFTSRIEGLNVAESDALLRLLFDHVAKDPTFHCRVRWRQGTVVFWDNRALQHFAIWDYHPHVRRGERVSICGTEPPQRAFPAGPG